MKHIITQPGLGDMIISITWWQKHNPDLKVYTRDALYRPELFEIMGVDISVSEDVDFHHVGHHFPFDIKKIEQTKEPPIIKGDYYTYQFNGSSEFPQAKNIKIFNDQEKEKVKQKYKGKLISVEDKTISLKTIRNIMQNSKGHFGIDSGMAWLAVLCGVKNIDVWYNGYSNYFDTNWLLTFAYNNANIKFYRNDSN